MRIARLQIGTIGIYFVAVALVICVGLGANERFTLGWGVDSSLSLPLLALHVVVGAIVGRWWAVALPVGWAILAIPAGEGATPLFGIVAVQMIFLWAPALLVGVVGRKLIGSHGTRSSAVVAAALAVVPLAGGFALMSAAAGYPTGDVPTARYGTIDEERGTYGGVGIGDPLERVLAVHGLNSRVRGNQSIVPRDAAKVRDGDLGWSGHSDSAWWYCYDDVCFWLNASPKREPKKATVGGIVLASPGATTPRGIQVGDALDDAKRAYPELVCRSESFHESIVGGYRVCTGLLPRGHRIWFGGDPINVILVSSDWIQ